MSGQTEMWETPRLPVDPRPLETGGALVIIRLTVAEVEALLPLGFPLVEAVHMAIEKAQLGSQTGLQPPDGDH